MSVKLDEFIGKFGSEEIQGAEIKLAGSLDYYIVQKHGKKTDLYVDKETEYPEDPPVRESVEMLIMTETTGGTAKFGSDGGLCTITKYEHKKEAELVKHLKDIKKITKYINFEEVSEIIYETT